MIPFQTQKYPLIWLSGFLILGIILGKYWDFSLPLVGIFILVNLLILIGIQILGYRNNIQKIGFQIILSLTFVCLGYFQFHFTKPTQNKKHFTHFQQDELSSFQVTIQNELKPNPFQQQFIAKIHSQNNEKREGSILLKIPKSAQKVIFKPGDMVVFPGKIEPIPSSKNPYQFDYSEYQKSKGVYGQVSVNHHLIYRLGVEKNMMYYFGIVRNHIQKGFEKASFSETNKGILMALLIGNRQFIDKQTSDDFANAGAIHVLAISGLHIGILLYFFNIFLKPLGQKRKSRILKLVLQLAFLWSFAVLAGMSASVVRAVTMFSFMSIGFQMLRGTNIYNTLAASVLILLVIKPDFLFDVGFQMSYIAVLGIVSIQPYFQKLWQPQKKIVQYFYDLITVSIAAQLALLPLCLYYFHQFPGLFLLTNLIVIPLVTLALLCGLICIIFIVFASIPNFLAGFMNAFLTWLVDFISWIAQQDDFLFKEVPFHISWVIISSVFIVSFILWIVNKKRKMIFGILFAFILFQISWIYLYHIQPKTELIVLHRYKKNHVLLNQDGKITSYQNDTLETNNQLISQYETGSFSKVVKYHKIPNIILFRDYRILIVDSLGVIPDEKFTHWILMKNPKINLERLVSKNTPKAIIADGSNMPYLMNHWKKTCQNHNVSFHATSEKGFFYLE